MSKTVIKNVTLFVYGTLKSGQPNHHWLTKNENGFSRYLGNGRTVTKYPLIIATKYNIPFLLNEPGIGNNISGEVYEVDEKMLGILDDFEGHPNFYVRRLEKIENLDDNFNVMDCWAYVLENYKIELLNKVMLTNYDSNGDHGLAYSPKLNRDLQYNYKDDVLNYK